MNCKKKPEPRREAKSPASPAATRAELEVLRQKSVELIIQKPEKASKILSEWLSQPAGAAARRNKSA